MIVRKFYVNKNSIKQNECYLYSKSIYELNNITLQELSQNTVRDYLEYICIYPTEKYNQDIDNIRYLLPRALELLVQGHELSVCVETTLDQLHCNHSMWFDHELDFLQKFAKAYFKSKLLVSSEEIIEYCITEIVEIIVMFDNAQLSTEHLIAALFNTILKNLYNFNVIKQIIKLVYDCNTTAINPFASHKLNKQFRNFINSHNFKNAFTTAIFHKIEKENITQDEMNTYEVAFEVLSEV